MENVSLNLLVLFDGTSEKRCASTLSAVAIMKNVDRFFLKPIMVGVTEQGQWIMTAASSDSVKDGSWIDSQFNRPCSISFDSSKRGLLVYNDDKTSLVCVDCVFPLLYGTNKTNGAIQGLLESAELPYVGSGVTASAICADKELLYMIAERVGIKHKKMLAVNQWEFQSDCNAILDKAKKYFDGTYPLLITVYNYSLNCRTFEVSNSRELCRGIREALTNNTKVVIEQHYSGRILEVVVSGNSDLRISEIVEKTTDSPLTSETEDGGAVKIRIPASLSASAESRIKDNALKLYSAVGARGLSVIRFVCGNRGQAIFSEMDTSPDFSNFGMFAKLVQNDETEVRELISYLVQLAIENFERQHAAK